MQGDCDLFCLFCDSGLVRDQNSFQIIGDEGCIESSEWWGR